MLKIHTKKQQLCSPNLRWLVPLTEHSVATRSPQTAATGNTYSYSGRLRPETKNEVSVSPPAVGCDVMNTHTVPPFSFIFVYR